MELTLATRRQITKAQVDRYRTGTKAEKSALLDAICQVTGWHRDHARKALRQRLAGPAPVRAPRVPTFQYDQAVIDALVTCWSVLDGPTGKRLRPGLPTLVPTMLAHQELTCPPQVIDQLLGMSAATIDRRLRPYRTGLVATKGQSMTRPGSMLKSAIPMKTWHDWDDTRPGFLQIDLVGHEGGDNNGRSSTPWTPPTSPPAGPKPAPCAPKANASWPPASTNSSAGSRS